MYFYISTETRLTSLKKCKLHFIMSKFKSKNKQKTKQKKELILQLPINSNDLEQIEDNITENKRSSETNNIFTLGTNSSSEENSNDYSVSELRNQIKKKDSIIEKLNNKLELLQKNSVNYKNCNKNVAIDFNVKFINKEIDYENNSVMCWWCHHNIPDTPVFLPDRYYNGVYYVSGAFCSFPCAARYNASVIDDYRVSERYCFLKQMYNEMFNNKDDIKLAEDWRLLKGHGGYMSIEEFRNKSNNSNVDCRVLYPPMYFQPNILQERSKLDLSIADKHDNIVLKRSKPLPRSKNTLMETMGLVCEKKN